MSDEIKTFYNDMVEEIVPDEKFLNSLVDVLEKEQTQIKRQKTKIYYMKRILPMVACVVLVVGTAVFAGVGKDKQGTGVKVQQGDITSPVLTGNFEKNESVSADKSEYISKLYNKLISDTLAYIYVNNENTFVEEKLVSDEEKKNILEILKNGTLTDEYEKSDTKFFMAVFSDGEILKFNISGDTYMEIPSEEIFLKIF